LARGSWPLVGGWRLRLWVPVVAKMEDERFSFEDLEVSNEAVDFADQCLRMIEGIDAARKHF